MSFLLSLWLPIVVSAVAVFFASYLAWMVLPHHKSDWTKLADEEKFLQFLRDSGVAPGNYMFPHCSGPEEMKSPEFKQKYEAGPRGNVSLWAEVPNMGLNMFWTFVCFLVVSFMLAYLASIALTPGDPFLRVFRFVGTAGIMAYSLAGIPNAIWFKRKIVTDLMDGIAYGLLTGALFGLLWPAV